jgi:hypothetical protein
MTTAIFGCALIELLYYCCAKHLGHDQQLYALVSEVRLKDLRQIMLSRIPTVLHYSSTTAQSRRGPKSCCTSISALLFWFFFAGAKKNGKKIQ